MRLGVAAELDAAGIESAALRDGYAKARALNAEHGRTYYLATLLLPPEKRPYVHALYGFARSADDIVDTLDSHVSDLERAERFEAWAGDALAELEWGASSHPIRRALIDTIARYDIPLSYFADFLDAMRGDLTVSAYASWDDLERYMWGSSAVIGLQMLPILGRATDDTPWHQLEPYAINLGMAFQLTNFIRDVAEDLQRGRIYLPQDSLKEFGVDRSRLIRGVVDEPFRNLLAFHIERARALYCQALPGVELVHPTSQDCLRTAITLYSEILGEVEAADYDVFTRRVAVGRVRRARVAARGLRSAINARRAPSDAPVAPDAPTSSTSAGSGRIRIRGPRREHSRSADR